MTYFEKNNEMWFGANIYTMTSTHLLSHFVYMSDQNILSLIFPSSVTCFLTKTTRVQEFLVKDKENEWITVPTSPPFYESFKITKVGNFTTGVGKVTNFIFTQLYDFYDSLFITYFWLGEPNSSL